MLSTITLTLGWWLVPAIISIICIIGIIKAFTSMLNESGYFAGLGGLLALPFWAFILALSWAVYFGVLVFHK